MAGTAGTASFDVKHMTPMHKAAAAVGLVFLLVGILGLVPGTTTDYDQLKFAGHESEARLFGLFQVSILHNLVHLAFGVAGLAMARTWSLARTFPIGGRAIYLVLWVYGLVIDKASDASFRARQHRRQLAPLRPRCGHDRPRSRHPRGCGRSTLSASPAATAGRPGGSPPSTPPP